MDERTVLRKAKGVLLERGWHQGEFCADEIGDGPVCLAGAVAVARTGDPYGDHGSLEYLRLLGWLTSEYLDGRLVSKWNDDENRTVDDVIALIDRALGSLPAEAPELEKAVA